MTEEIGTAREILFYVVGMGQGLLVAGIIYVRSWMDKKGN